MEHRRLAIYRWKRVIDVLVVGTGGRAEAVRQALFSEDVDIRLDRMVVREFRLDDDLSKRVLYVDG